ncbi:MAG: transcriptional regulator [Novosphingobium lindaniclasticum]|jgi:predicted MarR family transcription regulator|nr:transcriptional regulator [Novosphingobium lindaniclasticum]
MIDKRSGAISYTPMSAKEPGPIISSAHLADGASPALSELEFSLTLAANAYQKWIARCAAAVGQQLTPLEVLVLHSVRHRDRPKRFMDLMLVLHVEDAHLVNYAVRKLSTAGLVVTRRVGKEKVIEVTAAGIDFCDAYRSIREKVLVGDVKASLDEAALSRTAETLRMLSGDYNQAARAAATL